MNVEPVVVSNVGGDKDIDGADEFMDRRARILKKLAEKVTFSFPLPDNMCVQ